MGARRSLAYRLRMVTVPVLAAMLAVALPGGSRPPVATAARAPFVARLYAPSHHPRAGKPWRIHITVHSNSGTPMSGRVRYEYLSQGQVVARRSNYRFRHGSFRDTLTWPAPSIGIALVFQPVVTTRFGTVRLPYPVTVRR